MRLKSAVLALILLAVPLPASAERVVVMAAASLVVALDDIARGWEEATGHEVAIAYGGSSLLGRQIEAGAPADVFLSAAPDWMDRVEAAGRVVEGSRVDLLGNRLVLVGAPGSPPVAFDAGLPTALGSGRLAVALTAAVPAGIYAKQALIAADIWERLKDRLAEADNVRAAAVLVALGAAPFGIVYATDAVASDDIVVLSEIDPSLHAPIRYPLALLSGSSRAAAEFHAHLRGSEAASTFAAAGFTALGDRR